MAQQFGAVARAERGAQGVEGARGLGVVGVVAGDQLGDRQREVGAAQIGLDADQFTAGGVLQGGEAADEGGREALAVDFGQRPAAYEGQRLGESVGGRGGRGEQGAADDRDEPRAVQFLGSQHQAVGGLGAVHGDLLLGAQDPGGGAVLAGVEGAPQFQDALLDLVAVALGQMARLVGQPPHVAAQLPYRHGLTLGGHQTNQQPGRQRCQPDRIPVDFEPDRPQYFHLNARLCVTHVRRPRRITPLRK